MKHEKKFWNDKSRKKKEKVLKHENYRSNNKYNNAWYKSQSNKFGSSKSNYSSYTLNVKNKNSFEIKSKPLGKRNNKNTYTSSYKRTNRNHKSENLDQNNVKRNSFYHEKYINSTGDKSYSFYNNYNKNNNDVGIYNNNGSAKYNKNTGKYNKNINNYNGRNIADNNSNNGSNYGVDSDKNNSDYNGAEYNTYGHNDRFGVDLHVGNSNNELNHINKDLYNLIYSIPRNDVNNLNTINSINNNVNNYNKQEINSRNITLNDTADKTHSYMPNTSKNNESNYQNYFNMQKYNTANDNENNEVNSEENSDTNGNENNHFKAKFRNFRNSYKMNITNNDNDAKNKNFNRTWTSANDNNNVLNRLSEIKNIPFRYSDNHITTTTNNNNDNFYVNDRNTMIINDLKKCLNTNEPNISSKNDNVLNNDYFENIFSSESNKNYTNTTTNINKISNNNSMNESNSNNNNNFLTLNNENINDYLLNQDEMRYNNRYNLLLNDNKSLQESSISNESSVADVNGYNREKGNYNDKFFPKAKIEESLRVLNTLQVDIERVCCYIKHFIDPPEQLFHIMTNVFIDKTVSINSKIAIFYVYNHLIQELRNKYKNDLNKYSLIAEKGLQLFVISVLRHILDEQLDSEIVNKFFRCISIWSERNIYSKFVCDQLKLLQKNPQKKIELNAKYLGNQNYSLISNQFSKFLPLSFIFKMPSINNEHKRALQDKVLSSLFNNLYKETLKNFESKDIEEASKISDKVMRMLGQELILINSQILELSSLINDNNDHLIKLRTSLEKLKE